MHGGIDFDMSEQALNLLISRPCGRDNETNMAGLSSLRASRTLATLRDTLLPKLLSGELSVADGAGK